LFSRSHTSAKIFSAASLAFYSSYPIHDMVKKVSF